ncbi:DegQ family serine endoprotease [Hippea sp. KM1]|uniref:DegQ family serine endoprotease n=1 Tax=Hippea sp. KM1 TaxID=944481 RepID=UPI00046CD467|nr:DegQ family serine endoprotease [Hippea sp. KM1]
MRRLRFLMVLIASIILSQSINAANLPNVRDVAKKVLPAVVNISTTQVIKYQNPFSEFKFDQNDPFDFFFKNFFNNFGPPVIKRKVHALGSGFIISKDGYILTNYHVIKRASDIRVTLLNSGDVYKAKVIGTDPKADIALIKIKPSGDLPTLKLGNSDDIEVGDWVVAVGNPFGLNGTVTVGIISAKGRVIGEGPFDHFLQTDAAINPGNSGGPLVNMKGEVIGINTAIIANGQGIGFAIPINMVKSELTYLMKGQKVKRGYLGVMIQPLTPEAAKSLNLKNTHGAIISQVLKDSAAYKAGLKPGDIIISVDNKPLKSSYDLPYIISSYKPGTTIKLGIIRDHKRITVDVKLGERPENLSETSQEGGVYKTDFGFSVANITPQIAKKYDLDTTHGVVIVNVEPNSFARMVGLKEGDVVVKLNYKPIKSVAEFKKIIEKAKNVIFLDILRGNTHIFITIQK